MQWLKTIVSEFIALFVDDGSFAVAIGAWLLLLWLLVSYLHVATDAAGPILFVGLGAILLESALRRARK